MAISGSKRLAELDLLRGLAVAGMILVVSPGDWAAAWPQLQHAPWEGARLADMVFPTFLFSVGIALGLSFPRPWGVGNRGLFWRRVLRRVVALIAIGLSIEASYNLLIWLGSEAPGLPGWSNIRLPGILQRIALCYLIGAAVMAGTGRCDAEGRLHVAPGKIALAIAVLLGGYWLAMRLTPVPGFGVGRLDPAGNLAAYIDRRVFGVPHLWPLGTAVPQVGPAVYDPEGLLSTLPATANLLLGALAAVVVRRDPVRAPALLALAALGLALAGWLIDPLFPINKRIWSPSFALFSSGFSAVLLAALLAMPRRVTGGWAFLPLRVLGANAILAFILSAVMSRFGGLPLVPTVEGAITPQLWGDRLALRTDASPALASFLCALAVLALIVALLWPLHRRAIHFRV